MCARQNVRITLSVTYSEPAHQRLLDQPENPVEQYIDAAGHSVSPVICSQFPCYAKIVPC